MSFGQKQHKDDVHLPKYFLMTTKDPRPNSEDTVGNVQYYFTKQVHIFIILCKEEFCCK